MRIIALGLLAWSFLAASSLASAGDGLVRISRTSDSDLETLLAAGVRVTYEAEERLIAECGEEQVRWLQAEGYAPVLIDPSVGGWDYFVLGFRGDSDLAALGRSGSLVHFEGEWGILRAPAGEGAAIPGDAKVFVTRLGHGAVIPQVPRDAVPFAADAQPLVQRIVDSVSGERIAGTWADLVANPPLGTRYTYSQGCRDAARYCASALADAGLRTEEHAWSASSAPNVIAEIPGSLHPEQVYILVAHLDDMPSAGLAPGADDNASGSVDVLEVARAMSCYAYESTVKFLLVTGEETGLNGSEAYAASAAVRGERIQGVINMDMIGWEGDGTPVPEDLDLDFNRASEPLALLFAECASRYGTDLRVNPIRCRSFTASDHYPFWLRGWRAVCGITDNESVCGHPGSYPYYHTSEDVIARCGPPEFFHAVVRATAAALAHAARPFRIALDQDSYGCGAELGVLVSDRDVDEDHEKRETLEVAVSSGAEPEPETLTLTETGGDTALFAGSIPLSLDPSAHGDGALGVARQDVVTAAYTDALECGGLTAVPYAATAPVDCPLPAIDSVVKRSDPFRLLLQGSGFRPGCVVQIDGSPAPSSRRIDATRVAADGGAALKALLPRGRTVSLTVLDTEDGGLSAPFSYTR